MEKAFSIELLGGQKFEVKPTKGSGLDAFEVAYFTASCDKEDINRDYAKKLKLDYPILSDPGKKVAKAYGVVHKGRGVPERWTFYIGKDGKLLYIDKKVNAGSHGTDISTKLKKLRIDKAKKKEEKKQ